MKHILLYLFLLICTLSPLQSVNAQTIGGVSVGSRLQNAARQKINRAMEEGKDAVREGINEKKGELKREVRSTKEEIKSGTYSSIPRAGGGGTMVDAPETMDDLIEDPYVKSSIEDRNNKKRFVNLFGQWWSLPSDSDFDTQKYLDSLRRARNNIDSSKYRVPKMVTRYQPVTVWGWHSAENGNNNYKSYNYSVVNTIAYSAYDINPESGAPLNPIDLVPFASGDFTRTVRQDTNKPVVIFLTLACHSAADVAMFLNQNITAQQNLIDTVLMLLDTAKANGVEVNFERIPIEYKDNFIKFIKILASSLRRANPNYAVCVSVPSRDPQGIFDVVQMRSFVDFFVIRGYDFYQEPPQNDLGSYILTEGPASPLNFMKTSPNYDLRKCVEYYLGLLGNINSNRLILGLPYIGTVWESRGGVTNYMGNMTYRQIMFEYVSKDVGQTRYDKDVTTYKWEYVDSTDMANKVTTTIYYDNAETLLEKYQIITRDYRLGGVALYELGNDTGFEDLWQVLANEFTYVSIPKDKRWEKAEMASKKSRRYGTIILATLFYLTIFMACGFFKALLNAQVRQTLFQNGKFRLWYLGFFTLVLLILGGYLGLFEGKTSTLLFGVLGGAALGWLVLKLVANQQAKQP